MRVSAVTPLSLSLSMSVSYTGYFPVIGCSYLGAPLIQGNYSFVNFQPHMPYLILEWIRITLHVDDTCMQ